jgi:hypothetical protein
MNNESERMGEEFAMVFDRDGEEKSWKAQRSLVSVH